MTAMRGGLGDILAGVLASVALAILVFPLGFGLLLAIPLAVGIYAGLVLLLPEQADRRPRPLSEGAGSPDEAEDCTVVSLPLPSGTSVTDEATVPMPAHVAAARRWGLTRREHEIVILLCTSHPMMTNQELAADLSIAFRTVDNHVARILDKLGLKSRRELPAFAKKHGLLPPVTPANPTE